MPVATQREMKSAHRVFELKAVDESARTFTGLAAAWSLDQGGDIILPGAFKRTLKDWKSAKRRLVPLLDAHDRWSVRSVVGKMIDAEEVKDGLEATFEVIDGPDGDETYRRVKGGYVDGLSIGYEPMQVRTPTAEERQSGVQRFLKEVKLLEVSVVPFPMNVDARIDPDSMKALLAKTDLSPDEVEELKGMQEQILARLAASQPGLAPDDSRRLQLEAKVRSATLRRLGLPG